MRGIRPLGNHLLNLEFKIERAFLMRHLTTPNGTPKASAISVREQSCQQRMLITSRQGAGSRWVSRAIRSWISSRSSGASAFHPVPRLR